MDIILVTVLCGLLAALATILSVILGFVMKGQGIKIKELKKELELKQSKELCMLEHGHIKETLLRIERCVSATSQQQITLMRKFTRLESRLGMIGGSEDDD